VLRAPQMITGGTTTSDGWVAFHQGRISAVGSGPAPSARQVIDDGAILVPGYVDIHCHGGGGHGFDDGPTAISHALAYHRAHGTTRSVLSLITAPMEDLLDRVEAARQVCAADSRLLGIHLEGPFLSSNHRGAHAESMLLDPLAGHIEALLDAAGGRLAQVTLAPELPNGLRALDTLVQAGVRVAVGHSAADYDQAAAAFDAGATILTHAFNGMVGMHHRAPGPVLAAADAPDVTCEVINDGSHVHPRVVRLLHDLAPGRVAYITDAMVAAGCADGSYRLGTLAVTVTDGVPRLDSDGSIAGSTLTMQGAVQQAVRIGVPLPEAVQAATQIPARALGQAGRIGALQPGYCADALLLDQDLQVRQVWADGQRVGTG